jgi:hypothetical protein
MTECIIDYLNSLDCNTAGINISHKNLTQIRRILKVYKKDISVNFIHYFKYNIFGMLLTLSKIVFYQIYIYILIIHSQTLDIKAK